MSGLAGISATRVSGANDRVRMGLIGSGGRGKQDWTTFLKQPDFEPLPVCDLYQPFREKGIPMAPGRPKPFTDFRNLSAQKAAHPPTVPPPAHRPTPFPT